MNETLHPLPADYPLPPPEHRDDVGMRLRAAMERDHLDALVLTSPENFYYATGSASSLAYFLPYAGVAAIAVLWRTDERFTVIINDFEGLTFPHDVLGCDVVLTAHWSGVDRGVDQADDEQPPTSLNGGETFQRLTAVLSRLSATARVGVDLPYLQTGPHAALTEAIAGRDLVDATPLLDEVRARKTRWEIENLRVACGVTETAIRAAAALIRPGVTEADLRACHDGTILGAGVGARVRFSGISIGQAFSIRQFTSVRPGEVGELVRFDSGAHVLEYGADLARVFSIGTASAAAHDTYAVLARAQAGILSRLGPGVSMRSLFEDAVAEIRAAGLSRYRRGHLGHSVGIARWVEEPPLIARQETAILQPGMVLSVEVPYYSVDLGAMNIEDMVLITEDGCDVFSTLPTELIEVG